MEKLVKYLVLAIFGFIAQLIDGGIGMGYGVSLTTLLLSIGFTTSLASASTHISEVFTSLASGISHFKLGNFDKKIFTYLVLGGVFGGFLGAYASVRLQNFTSIRPIISGMLLFFGFLIIFKFTKKKKSNYIIPRIRGLMPLGFFAAFIDAIGGGVWGPITSPTLIATNSHPSKTIGSVNFAEFFIALTISITFFMTHESIDLGLIIPLIIGGVIAAPIAAIITRKINHKVLGMI